MTDPDALFDADAYGHTSRTARETKPKIAPEVRTIQASDVWRLVSKLTPGVVHAHAHGHSSVGDKFVAMPTWCGKAGVPQTFRPGETVMGCVACANAGAKFRYADEPPA